MLIFTISCILKGARCLSLTFCDANCFLHLRNVSTAILSYMNAFGYYIEIFTFIVLRYLTFNMQNATQYSIFVTF